VKHNIAIDLTLAATVSCLLACSDGGPGWQPPQRDFRQFQSEVFPVLVRDCAFSTCHGSEQRFFHLWAPGRTRLNPMTRAFDVLTGDEVSDNFQRALSMVDTKDPSQSLLLRKPLAVEAGGAGHRGVDNFGRNLYRTVNADGYLTLSRWVFGVPSSGASTGASTGSGH
jgi:hypothetical protein